MYIPDDKRYFRIGEVSRIVGVKPYVLRYWESQFAPLRPKRADSRQRVYQREDIETLGAIRKMLYEERLTIQGAKARLKAIKQGDQIATAAFVNILKDTLVRPVGSHLFIPVYSPVRYPASYAVSAEKRKWGEVQV